MIEDPRNFQCHKDYLWSQQEEASEDICEMYSNLIGGAENKSFILKEIQNIAATDKRFWEKSLANKIRSAFRYNPALMETKNLQDLKLGIKIAQSVAFRGGAIKKKLRGGVITQEEAKEIANRVPHEILRDNIRPKIRLALTNETIHRAKYFVKRNNLTNKIF